MTDSFDYAGKLKPTHLQSEAEFDGWLSDHDRRVRAEAWDEAADRMVWHDGNWLNAEAETIVNARKFLKKHNPYKID